MENFTLRWPHGRLLWGLRRNDMLRISDRVEAIATVFAMVLVVLAIPVAAAVGTSSHERLIAAETARVATLRSVTAKAMSDGRAVVVGPRDDYVADVSWTVDGATHTGVVEWPSKVHAGDEIGVWLDPAGDLTSGPAPAGQAAVAATVLAAAAWLSFAAVMAVATWVLRWWLDVGRLIDWERELESFPDGSRH